MSGGCPRNIIPSPLMGEGWGEGDGVDVGLDANADVQMSLYGRVNRG